MKNKKTIITILTIFCVTFCVTQSVLLQNFGFESLGENTNRAPIPRNSGSSYNQILQDSEFIAGSFSNSAWIPGRESWGENQIDDSDTYSYRSDSVGMTIKDDAASGTDLNEKIWIEQELEKYFFHTKSNYTVNLVVDYSIDKTAGDGWFSESTDFKLQLFVNNSENEVISSYSSTSTNQPSWSDSDVKIIPINLQDHVDIVNSVDEIPVRIELTVNSIAYDTTVRVDLNSVKLCGELYDYAPEALLDITSHQDEGSYEKGGYSEIQWDTIGDIPRVDIHLMDEENKVAELVDYDVPNTGSYNWIINPALENGDYYLLINATSSNTTAYANTNAFSLVDGNYATSVTELLSDPQFTESDFSSSAWKEGAFQLNPNEGSIDADDFAYYDSGNDKVHMEIKDNQFTPTGPDKEELVYINQSFSNNFISSVENNTVNVSITYQFQIDQGNTGVCTELSDISLKFGFNGEFNWLLDSYVAFEQVQVAYDSGIVTKEFSIPVEQVLDYPYLPENVCFQVSLYAMQISYEKVVQVDLYEVSVLANTAINTQVPKPPLEKPYIPRSNIEQYEYVSDQYFSGESHELDWAMDMDSVELGTLCNASINTDFHFNIEAPGIHSAFAFDVTETDIQGVFAFTDVGTFSLGIDAGAAMELSGGLLEIYKGYINPVLTAANLNTLNEFVFNMDYSYDYETDIRLGTNKVMFDSYAFDLYSTSDYLLEAEIWTGDVLEFGFTFESGLIIKPYLLVNVSLEDIEIEISGTATNETKTFGPDLSVTRPTEFAFDLPLTTRKAATLQAQLKSATMQYTLAGFGCYIGFFMDVDTYFGEKTDIFDYDISAWVDSEIVNTKIFWDTVEPSSFEGTKINPFGVESDVLGTQYQSVQSASNYEISIEARTDESNGIDTQTLMLIGGSVAVVIVISIVIQKKRKTSS